MFRANLVASLLALALFSWAQAKAVDPLGIFDGRPGKSSSTRSTYHK